MRCSPFLHTLSPLADWAYKNILSTAYMTGQETTTTHVCQKVKTTTSSYQLVTQLYYSFKNVDTDSNDEDVQIEVLQSTVDQTEKI